MNRSILFGLGAFSLALGMAVWQTDADPVDDELVIDGEIPIKTRAPAPDGLPFDELISGWHYRTAETRSLEADSFENPGMLFVERGAELWETVDGAAGKSCADCHGDASGSMADVGAAMPKWHDALQKPVNLELQINLCRTEQMQAEPYAFDDADQRAMTTFVRYQSLGKPVEIDLDAGDMQSWWERGKEVYYTRTGQLDLSCASCHELNNGNYLRADHLSQGHTNGFPTYRLKQGTMISLHNRFRGCIRDTRAKQPAAFSDELMALEVYTAWRGQGLSVETPAVRQ